MLIHAHSDGSEGYEYEIGDRVIVKRTIGGGWFDFGPTRSERCVVERFEDERPHWRIRLMEVRYSPDWGPARCFPWMVKPHPETIEKARRVPAEDA